MTTDTPERRTVELRRLPIELFKLLKYAGLAQSGGEAKTKVAAGLVMLNGEVETRKSKKVVAGDIVSLDGQQLQVVEEAPA